VTDRYRRICEEAGEWFCEEFLRLARPSLEKTRRTRNAATLEVTTVGLRIYEGLTDQDFDAWLFEGDAANLANDELRTFFAAAADVDFDIADLKNKEPESYWVSMPGAVQAEDGTLVSRRVLYMVRAVADGVQIVGIGLDDSGSGDLANDIALKFSRRIANGI
jgi:hypothetical protein